MLINDFVYQLMNNIFGAENALQLFKIISIIGDTEYSILLLIIIGCILYFLENKSHSKYLILLVLLNASFIKVLK
ncbi:MAG: hypothetical protein QM532_00810 [Cyanobium sp. MAG06]|nr:hypothetical protein [Cyanobium sp. MAG06]